MWTFEHTITTPASAAAIWALYSDLNTWTAWDHGITHASLDGEFVVGARGWLQPEGQERLAFQLTAVEPLRGFSDLTDIPQAGLQIAFDHRLEETAAGTRLTHRVTITGPNAEQLGPKFGAHMTVGIPQTMAQLASLALEREQAS